jgi:acetyltransferase-like isoleucine patch superfamily enzyme
MLFQKFFKLIKAINRKINRVWSTFCTHIIFWGNGIKHHDIIAYGIPCVNVSLGGRCFIGKKFCVRTGIKNSEVGLLGTRILVGRSGVLQIGNNVGMTNATIVAQESVTIGDNVMIGGGVQIFDTNFHSTDAKNRTRGKETPDDVKKKLVVIGNNVFIGTNAIICKGVVIPDETIVPAGSVVYSSKENHYILK